MASQHNLTQINRESVLAAVRALVEKCTTTLATPAMHYNEANTRKDFIMPLFNALGWNVADSSEVYEEQAIAGESVDYSFQIRGIPRFYLEAKPLRENLSNPRWVKQAVSYAYNKGLPWVVLSSFKELRVYNVDIDPRPFLTLTYEQFCDDIDMLLLLSKPAIAQGELDAYAMKVGAMPPKRPIEERLFSQLRLWREQLFSVVHQYRGDLSYSHIDEAIQRLFGRLMFIRTAEDRQLEQRLLLPLVNQQRSHKLQGSLWSNIRSVFVDCSNWYDSDLFMPGLVDELHFDDPDLAEIILGLYEAEGGMVSYDFSIINADVLGRVYEQYLGYVATLVEQRSKSIQLALGTTSVPTVTTEDVIAIEAKPTKQRSEGAYYTPAWVVEHMLDAVFESMHDSGEAPTILDPSCGSGSFLIKALEKLLGDVGNTDKQVTDDDRMDVIASSIFGVDKDRQAVEIARLNLLLKALRTRRLLPPLANNIKTGDSLVGSANDHSVVPFAWEEEFEKVLQNGGFDAIVGNPPWLALTGPRSSNIDKALLPYYRNVYQTANDGIVDTFSLFIERSTQLLREGGMLAFVLPDYILLKNYPITRRYLLEHYALVEIVHIGRAFKNVNSDAVIVMGRKESKEHVRKSNMVRTAFVEAPAVPFEFIELPQEQFLSDVKHRFNLSMSGAKKRLFDRITEKGVPLGTLFDMHEGIHSGNVRDKLFLNEHSGEENVHPLIFGRDELQPFQISWRGKFVHYDKSIIDRHNGEYAGLGKASYYNVEKILVRRTGDKVIAAVDRNSFFASNNMFVLFPKHKGASEWLLDYVNALLNSTTMNAFFRILVPRKGRLFAEMKIEHLRTFPIPWPMEKVGPVAELVTLARKASMLVAELEEVGFDYVQRVPLEESLTSCREAINQSTIDLFGLDEGDIGLVSQLCG